MRTRLIGATAILSALSLFAISSPGVARVPSSRPAAATVRPSSTRPVLGLPVWSVDARIGARFKVSATVFGGRRAVWVQYRLNASKVWRTYAKYTSARTGKLTFTEKVLAGPQYWRAYLPKSGKHPVAISQSRRIVGHAAYTETGFAALAASGGYHACAVTTVGTVKCWGGNDFGQLGIGSVNRVLAPVTVSGLPDNVAQVGSGGLHTCARTVGGAVYCWGDNRFGQLGNGTTTNSSVPVQVTGLDSGVVSIVTGGGHSCATLDSGVIKCWGLNDAGQIGDGTTTDALVPVVITFAEPITSMALDGSHSCAIGASKSVYCWGSNQSGQLGISTGTQYLTPTLVTGLAADATQLAIGGLHSCVLTTLGLVRCWGDNRMGELGNGTTASSSTPTTINTLSNVVQISTQGPHPCALTADGRVYCWGVTFPNAVGTGSPNAYWTNPVLITGLRQAKAVMVGGTFSCALGVDSGVQCWGDNNLGQLATGTLDDAPNPVTVIGLK